VVGLFAYRSYFNKKYTLSVLYSGSLALLIIICLSILRVNGYEDLGVLIILFLLCLFLYSGYVYKHGKLLDTYDGFERNQITTVLGYFVLFYYSFSWTFKLCIVVAYAFGIGDIINCVACEFYEI
ncbi:MAG: hypothetical protein OEZ01_12750, partial [Candidatus Heimdallarchaeota archaeon]|nr:hypothetical protein [Candidatus Heimdallarchaeota archaeon]